MTAALARPVAAPIPAVTRPDLLTGLALFGFPLAAVASAALGLPSTPISVMGRALVLGLSLMILLRPMRNGLWVTRSLQFWLLGLFWAVYLGRIAVALASEGGLSRSGTDYWSFALGACLIPMAALALAGPLPAPDRLCTALLRIGLAGCALALWLAEPMALSAHGAVSYAGRYALPALNPIFFGHFAASMTLLGYWAARNGLAGPMLVLAALGVGLAGVVLSGSRGPVVALAGALVLAELARGGRALVLAALAMLPIGLLMLADPLALDRWFGVATIARFGSGLRLEDAAAVARTVSFAGAWQQFAAHPWLGDALEESRSGLYPHNLFLEALMTTGLVGATALVTALVALTGSLARLLRQPAAGWIAVLALQYGLAAQFSGSIYSATALWPLLGLVLSQGGRAGIGGHHAR